MELGDLEAFLAVVEHGGFRSAADALFLSQPSLTRRVKRIEQELDVQLLERGPWGLRLTGHGEKFVVGARRVLTTVEEARASTIGAWGQLITLGAAATAAGSYLAAFLSEWIPRHPETRLEMIEDGAMRLRRRLAEQECDVAILASPVPPEFDSLPITRVDVEALLPHGHPLALEEGPLDLQSLADEPLLVNGAGFLSTELLTSSCRLLGIEPEIIYSCTVGQTLASLAEAGLGIAILSDNVDLRGFDLPTRLLVNADGQPLSFELHVAWSRARSLPPSLYRFAEELSEFTLPLRLHSVSTCSMGHEGCTEGCPPNLGPSRARRILPTRARLG